MIEFEMEDRKSSPDCSENPFFEKKIVTKSWKKLLKSTEDESGNFIGLKIDFSFVEMTNSM
ncbi:hypothetical protein [Chryseobacterium sp. 5_R23647]|uniref:hypothetical protein n=1 Tax=Chryseobacterium sp. 5_R23647 TaxID=2258964 RepID=UPI000E2657C5|nr:hypothetical protein [Chryseobacterium sp. 5_R23647]REC42379.1 hypothetical protein DRF69_11355 [Chryseobacterium sp. 5_R23647]